jgi:hypothetical protein
MIGSEKLQDPQYFVGYKLCFTPHAGFVLSLTNYIFRVGDRELFGFHDFPSVTLTNYILRLLIVLGELSREL